MSSLPLLSHHLFVAAVERKERPPRSAQQNNLPPLAAEDDALAVPLEVLDAAEPMPLGSVRPLRSALVLGGN